jgi:general secretion pathway protein E
LDSVYERDLKSTLIEKNKSLQRRLEELFPRQHERSDEDVAKELLETELISENKLLEAFSDLYRLPFKEAITFNEINAQLVKNLNMQFCLQNLIVPIEEDLFSVTVAISSPFNLNSIDVIQSVFQKTVHRILFPKTIIEGTINNLFERVDLTDRNSEGLKGEDDIEGIEGLDVAHNLLEDNEEAPVRKEVTTIIRRGITEKASDIHIEPFEDQVSVRFRMDGHLKEVRVIPKKYQSSVTTRIKILAKLNIAESRLPQDGRITLKVGTRDIDVRVSTLPIKFGERIVMRILDKSGGLPQLEKIGMPVELLKTFQNLVQQKHGIVLVTGPTGSGKTTTLASALMSVNKPDTCIITVEDPVEIQLPGVSQVEVNDKAGLTFAAALRSILRQNPNIILIGEIRDAETAQIAVQASITGHLVFSTLHTNDTASSVTRLVDFGIEPFQITTAVLGILAVRLIRKLCMECREEHYYSDEQIFLVGLNREKIRGRKLYRAKENGCFQCKNTGYAGRLGIYELLVFDEMIRNFVLKSSDGASLKKLCIQRGMKTLRDNVHERLLNGETSLEEALYGTQDEGGAHEGE